MVRLSSKNTFFLKRVFPVIWFAFPVVFLASLLLAKPGPHPPALGAYLVPLAVAGAGFFIMRRFVFDLADSVWDDGDALVVKNRGWEERVALANIMNVGWAPTNPPRITLTLREPCRFGREVVFSPPSQAFLFGRPPKVARELIERVDAARPRSSPR